MTAPQSFTTTGRIGIEIEVRLSESRMADITGLDDVGYNHDVYSNFVIKHDSSCGSEIVTPPIPAGYKGREYRHLRDILAEVNSASRTPINEACSVHVHVGVDVHTPELLEAHLGRLWRMYDLYRRDAVNQWCGESRNPEMSAHAQRYCGRFLATHGGKYGQINATQLFRHIDGYGEGMPTIEFRQMHASTDIDRIWEWATFCYLLVNGSVRPSIMTKAGVCAKGRGDDFAALFPARLPRRQVKPTPEPEVTPEPSYTACSNMLRAYGYDGDSEPADVTSRLLRNMEGLTVERAMFYRNRWFRENRPRVMTDPEAPAQFERCTLPDCSVCGPEAVPADLDAARTQGGYLRDVLTGDPDLERLLREEEAIERERDSYYNTPGGAS